MYRLVTQDFCNPFWQIYSTDDELWLMNGLAGYVKIGENYLARGAKFIT